MKTINRLKSKSEVIGPTFDKWITLSERLDITHTISGLTHDGDFFVGKNSFSIGINIPEYEKTGSHTHKMGGDSEMRTKEIAVRFLKLPNVEKVYTYTIDKDDYYVIIVTEDSDDLSYQLAKIKVDITDKYDDYDFEIRYMTKERFNEKLIPTKSYNCFGR